MEGLHLIPGGFGSNTGEFYLAFESFHKPVLQ